MRTKHLVATRHRRGRGDILFVRCWGAYYLIASCARFPYPNALFSHPDCLRVVTLHPEIAANHHQHCACVFTALLAVCATHTKCLNSVGLRKPLQCDQILQMFIFSLFLFHMTMKTDRIWVHFAAGDFYLPFKSKCYDNFLRIFYITGRPLFSNLKNAIRRKMQIPIHQTTTTTFCTQISAVVQQNFSKAEAASSSRI